MKEFSFMHGFVCGVLGLFINLIVIEQDAKKNIPQKGRNEKMRLRQRQDLPFHILSPAKGLTWVCKEDLREFLEKDLEQTEQYIHALEKTVSECEDCKKSLCGHHNDIFLEKHGERGKLKELLAFLEEKEDSKKRSFLAKERKE